MKMVLRIIICVFLFGVIFASGYMLSSLRIKRLLYAQDLEMHVVNVEVSLARLEELRSKENDRAVSGLETFALGQTLGMADDEKVLGLNADIQNTAEKLSEYCARYSVFDGRTNLPSHRIAKQFLDSHRAYLNK